MSAQPAGNDRLILDVATILRQLVQEHRKLFAQIELQQSAMRALDTLKMEKARTEIEALRTRIAGLEHRRRTAVLQIGRASRLNTEPRIEQLAQLYPLHRGELLRLKRELKDVLEQIQGKSHIAGKVANAVLGHLNTAVRLLAGAVEQAGVYTKHGIPQMTARIGVMEAVG